MYVDRRGQVLEYDKHADEEFEEKRIYTSLKAWH
jgi:hypothetical protein